MKVIYEFNPDSEESDDINNLKMFQNASNMYIALTDLDNLRRSLYKGWKYYDDSTDLLDDDKPEDKDENVYSRINVDELLDDIVSILNDSKIFEIN